MTLRVLGHTSASARTYVDTSVCIALLAQEATFKPLASWLTSEQGELFSSGWTRCELASALAIKARREELTQIQVDGFVSEFETWVGKAIALLAVDNGDFAFAAAQSGQASHKLRGGDALHLAVAKRCGMTHIATLDKWMQANALRLGFQLCFEYESEEPPR